MSCSFHISSPLGSSSSLEGFSSLKVVVVACQALSRDLLGIDLVLLLLFWRPDKHPHWGFRHLCSQTDFWHEVVVFPIPN
ncbi:hypothetical protein NG271_271 [Saccharomyces cerevisiae synthetic construct]|uniref:Putative uncharacterized protein YDR015C n=1 Tax=Saccharomyces cerevisiae (strain ATCC 204508 / S288c) TaxID=559292 RepID=YD015_YEAST|nr:RecName: Full=Putative uncharacterized protein YDR015C [Saccharomyces cerevisiae S288C]KZV12247.1 hypothetical protein WN66_01068 [Saccharomyces cerevisiae]WNF19828.1 hypothetical protein NG271_271 [Saccharomyces cerevisiae synthetic construct]